MWLASGVAAAQGIDLTIEAAPDVSGVAMRLQRLDQSAMIAALARAGLPAPPRVRMILVGADAAASRESPSWVVGSAFGTDTIVIFPHRIGSYPYDSLDAVVVHELAHLALSLRAGDRPLPRWFHEGVAVSVESGWGLGSQARLLWAAQQDPAIDEVSRLFASEAQPATSTAYLLSAALVEHVRERHGAAVPGEIAARVAAGASFDDAFLAVTGETPDQAAATAWRMYRGLRWLPVLTSPSSVWWIILMLAGAAFVARRRRRRARRQRWELEDALDELRARPEDIPDEPRLH